MNPYGAGLYRVIWNYAHSQVPFAYISEFHANSFRQPAHFVELLLALGAFFLLGRRRAPALFQLLFLTLAAVVAFRTARDTWFVSLPAACVLAETWGILRREQPAIPQTPDEAAIERMAIWQWLAVGLGIAAILTLRGLDCRFSYATEIKLIETVYPLRAVRFLRQQHLPGPIYNSFNEGGFLIGQLPEYPVSIDGRTDLYPDEFIEHYLSVVGGPRTGRRIPPCSGQIW